MVTLFKLRLVGIIRKSLLSIDYCCGYQRLELGEKNVSRSRYGIFTVLK